MVDDVAIKVNDVGKTFRLPHERNASVKSALINFNGKRGYEKQEVLKDVSFEVKKGDFFGIVGRNGSGKSTLLKLLSGIYTPSRGSIQVSGKLTPFIELGVGFSPELTGRENVFLNGALLGFSRSEMKKMYNDIVAFAELEKFMDQKLKNYSSGMQVRLAFSIAIRAKSDILVLDEVLAVGDESFQRKCVKVFDEYKRTERTVILVTHDMQTVKKYCNRAILLNEGDIVRSGKPEEIAAEYSILNQSQGASDEYADKDSKIKLKIVKQKPNNTYQYGESLSISASWSKELGVETAGVIIYSSTGQCVYATNTKIDKVSLRGKNSLEYKVDLTIGVGDYYIVFGAFKGEDDTIIDYISSGPSFVVAEENEFGGEGLARLKHTWIAGK